MAILIALLLPSTAQAAPWQKAANGVLDRYMEITLAPDLLEVDTDALIDMGDCWRTSKRRSVCEYELVIWESVRHEEVIHHEYGKVVMAKRLHVRPYGPDPAP
jgi:hypothetical protein